MEYDISKEYVNIIKSKIKLGEYQNAIKSVNKLIDYDPNFAVAHYLRGICNYATGQFSESILDYSKAIDINSEFAKAYFNRGVAKYHLTLHKDAIADIEIAHNLFAKDNDVISARKCVESIDIIRQEGL